MGLPRRLQAELTRVTETRLTAIEDVISAQTPENAEDPASCPACTKTQTRRSAAVGESNGPSTGASIADPVAKDPTSGHSSQPISSPSASRRDQQHVLGQRITLSLATNLGHTSSSSDFDRDCANNWRPNPMTASVWLI